MIPRYKHDCNTCIYLGTICIFHGYIPKSVDIYYAPQDKCGSDTPGGVLIIRYGDERMSYWSIGVKYFLDMWSKLEMMSFFQFITWKRYLIKFHEVYRIAENKGVLIKV